MPDKTRILVVDDCKETLGFLEEVLRVEGYEPLGAETAFGALELMENNAFHAAIVDVILPDINGIDLLKKLRKIDPNLAPIVVTANGDLESAVEALNQGAEEYLLKPINVGELRAILGKVVTRRRTLDRKLHLEEMLRQSEERYRKSIADTDDAILLVNALDFRIVDANLKAQKLTGKMIQDLLRMVVFDLFPENAHGELQEIIRKIKRYRQDIFSHLSIKRNDGGTVPIEAHAVLISCKEGKMIQLICHDISIRRELEEKEWRSRRFTTFSEMANIARDQVSSPLTAILGQTEILRSRLKSKNNEVLKSLHSIEEQVRKVQNLFNNLQDYAALRSTDRKNRRAIKARAQRLLSQKERSILPKKHKILVVDDEPAMRTVLEDFFTMNGFEVISAGDGEEALNIFRNTETDLIITDITMPRMDGITLLREIKSIRSSLPVILMTGLNLNQIGALAGEYGADGYIMKPFSFYQIMKLVQDVITQSAMISLS